MNQSSFTKHKCTRCKKDFVVGEEVTGWDIYDDVDHAFTYDPIKNAVAIEFADDIHHKAVCTK